MSFPIGRVGTAAADATKAGPVVFTAPARATPIEIEQVIKYCAGCNAALDSGALSPVGRVSTAGQLRRWASRIATAERQSAIQQGTPYKGQAGHVPDTTWTNNPNPPGWMDLSPRVNASLGGQAAKRYPLGYKPTSFRYGGIKED